MAGPLAGFVPGGAIVQLGMVVDRLIPETDLDPPARTRWHMGTSEGLRDPRGASRLGARGITVCLSFWLFDGFAAGDRPASGDFTDSHRAAAIFYRAILSLC